MKKLTGKFVKKELTKFGWKLLSEYKDAHTPTKMECIEGHQFYIKYNTFQQGQRCAECSGNKKLTYNFIKQQIEKEGYKLLSKEYENTHSKLKVECPEGHLYEVVYNSFQQGHRCPDCWAMYFSGPNNPNWKGGISCEPYCEVWLDQEYKDSIKERDGYQCLNPTCSKENKTLCLHHINYNKKDCIPINLITICKSCNSKANSDRNWHESWYNTIIYKRYNRRIEIGCNKKN